MQNYIEHINMKKFWNYVKMLLGLEKKVVVWEDYYRYAYYGKRQQQSYLDCTFTYTIYQYSISGRYELTMEPFSTKILLFDLYAKDMPMYITARTKLLELQNNEAT